MLVQWLYPLFWQDAPANASISRDASFPSLGRTSEATGQIATDFHFEDVAALALSASERQRFIADFESATESLHAWSLEQAWSVALPRSLRVVVSTKFYISRALVPAWEGRSGTIEFPTRRVLAGRAAIVHELTHVFFPSGNRLLAEGLAIYLQALLGRNPAFPNFSQPLHEAARNRLFDVLPALAAGDVTTLAALDVASLDAIPTPNPLTLEIGGRICGEDKDGQATLYCLAGSFVQFLIDAYGLARFRRLYMLAPLRAGELDAGPANRWREVYGRSLTDIEGEWKSLLAEAPILSRAFG
jgi:hypothetical protein